MEVSCVFWLRVRINRFVQNVQLDSFRFSLALGEVRFSSSFVETTGVCVCVCVCV